MQESDRGKKKKPQLQQNSSVQSCKVTEERREDATSAGLSGRTSLSKVTNQGLGPRHSRETKRLDITTPGHCLLEEGALQHQTALEGPQVRAVPASQEQDWAGCTSSLEAALAVPRGEVSVPAQVHGRAVCLPDLGKESSSWGAEPPSPQVWSHLVLKGGSN